jgi:hypothetical protein
MNQASLYIVPGSAAPLSRISCAGNNLLLIYADRRGRLWDVKTQEFWRSMGLEKVNELLDQGGWTDLYVTRTFCGLFGNTELAFRLLNEEVSVPDVVLKRIPRLLGPDAGRTNTYNLHILLWR